MFIDFLSNNSKALDVLGSNATVEGCVEWILAHIDSTDLHQQPQSSTHEDYAKDAAPMASPLLESMGFSSLQVQAALKMSNGGTVAVLRVSATKTHHIF